MTDGNSMYELIKRLREHDDSRLYHEADVLMSEAADRIAALEKALREAHEREAKDYSELLDELRRVEAEKSRLKAENYQLVNKLVALQLGQ